MQVLIVGSASAPEFTDFVSSLRSLFSSDEFQVCRSVRDLPVTSTAELVVVLQQWPDEFTRAESLTLIDRHPLARLIVCYGPWCNSDGRTRSIWPHAVRVSVDEASSRLLTIHEHLLLGRGPLPLTATCEESLAHHLPTGSRVCKSPRRLCVLSADRGLREWIEDVLRDAGHLVDEWPMPATDGVVWDADPWSPGGRERLAGLLPMCVGKALIAMCGFPRSHEVREQLDAGIDLVLPKTLTQMQLLEEIERRWGSPSNGAPPVAERLPVHEVG